MSRTDTERKPARPPKPDNALPVVLVDSREQTPLTFTHLTAQQGSLATGDYSVLGIEDDFTVERKSMADLLGSLTGERDRFMRELQRMRAYPMRRLMVIGTANDLHQLLSRRKVTLESVLGSLAAIEARGIPVEFYPTPEEAALRVEGLAVYSWRHRLHGLAKVEIPTWARESMARRVAGLGYLQGGRTA